MNFLKLLKIGESQIPQILVMIVGLAFMIAFEFTDNSAFALTTLGCLQVSCVLMVCYDERQDEKKANAEAIAVLESKQ